MAREPADLKHTLGREGASIEGGHGPLEFDRARFLKMGAAGCVGALLGGSLATAEGAGLAVARPASGGGLYDEPFRGQFHFSPKRTGSTTRTAWFTTEASTTCSTSTTPTGTRGAT